MEGEESRRGFQPRPPLEGASPQTRQDAASTEPTYIVKPKRRRRWWLITLTIIVAFLCLWWFSPHHDRIMDSAAVLDQRDPRWHCDGVQASQPNVPVDEDAAKPLRQIGLVMT